MTESRSHQIEVKIQSAYFKEQSDPANQHYVFLYQVTLKNTGTEAAKLLSRHWVITDAHGTVQEVHGLGVVGEQPHLQPGETFEYTSGAVLNTPVGSMQGSYELVADDGVVFKAEVPAFSLAIPNILH